MATIIIPSEEVLVVEQEIASVIETEVPAVLVIEETGLNGVLTTEEQVVLLVESETSIIVETVVEQVLVVQETEIVVLEAAEQGPPGPPGPVGGTPVAGTTDLIYTGANLTRVDLPDGTHKLFTYLGNLLSRLDHVKTGQTVRKDFVYTGSRLEAVNTSFV